MCVCVHIRDSHMCAPAGMTGGKKGNEGRGCGKEEEKRNEEDA